MKKIGKVFSPLTTLVFIVLLLVAACTPESGGSSNNITVSPSGLLTVVLRPVNDFEPDGGWKIELIQNDKAVKSESIDKTMKQVRFSSLNFGDYIIKVTALDGNGNPLFSDEKQHSMKREISTFEFNIESKTPTISFSVGKNLPQEITKVAVTCADGEGTKVVDYKNGESFQYSLAKSGSYSFTFSFRDSQNVEYFTAEETVDAENGTKSVLIAAKQTKLTPLIFSLRDGSTVAKGDTLKITCNSSVTAIYYTTDGKDPTIYKSEIVIEKSMTVKAYAYAVVDGKTIESEVKIASYTVDENLLKLPTISGVTEGSIYKDDVTIEISNSGEGDIYYTLDGTTPTSSSTKYESEIKLSDAKTYTLKAIVISGSKQSAVATVNFEIQKETVSKPVISPEGKTYSNVVRVTISCSTVGASIYYTTDGTDPTESSERYSNEIPLTSSGTYTLKAIAVKGGLKSTIVSATYTLDITQSQTETPVITPATGTFSEAQNVTITCGTSGADIYYTTDGTNPTEASTKYTSSFPVSTTTTVKAIAVKDGSTSPVASSVITIQKAFDGIQIQVEKSLGFNQIHYWDCSDEAAYPNTAWPGVPMDDTYDDYYIFEFEDADSVSLLITKGSGDKLADSDIEITSKGFYKITKNGKETSTYISKLPQPPKINIPTSAKIGGSFKITVTSDSALTSSSVKIGSVTKNLTIGDNTFNVADFTSSETTLQVTGSISNAAGSTPVNASIKVTAKPVVNIVSDPNELRIYQVMVASFQDGDSSIGYTQMWGPDNQTKGGDLQGIINAIPYIKELGCNALWMTPIFDSKGDTGDNRLNATGYFAYDYFNIDPKFGTNEKFAELVEKCHNEGISVILDGVFGHNKGTVASSPNRAGIKNPGITPDTSNPVNYATNQNSLKYYSDVASYWITEYKIDGWRLDQCYQVAFGENAKGTVADNCNTGGHNYWYDIRKVVETAAASNGTRGQDWGTLGYMVGEHWRGDASLIQNGSVKAGTAAGYGLNSCFDFPAYYQLVQGFAQEWDGKTTGNIGAALSYTYKTYSEKGYSCKDDDGSYDTYYPNVMLTNHDLFRIGDLINKKHSTGFDSDAYIGRNKVLIAAQCAYTGPITIYYGDEIGDHNATTTSGWGDDNVARSSGKITGFNSREQKIHDWTAKCLASRAAHKALWGGTNAQITAESDFYVAKKTGGGETIYIAFNNNGSQSKSFSISGSGEDLLTGKTFNSTVDVPALSARYVLIK